VHDTDVIFPVRQKPIVAADERAPL